MDYSHTVSPTPPRPSPHLSQVFPTCHLLVKAFLGHLVTVTAPGLGNVLSSFFALLAICVPTGL